MTVFITLHYFSTLHHLKKHNFSPPRFVYYGLFGGAVFYMQRVLGFSASSSSTIKNAIEGLIYLAPILGAVLADSYLGKVSSVFLLSLIYSYSYLLRLVVSLLFDSRLWRFISYIFISTILCFQIRFWYHFYLFLQL